MSPAVSHRSNDDHPPRRHGSAKLPRDRPIYTDSEDENEREKVPRREERVVSQKPPPQKKPRRSQLPLVLPNSAEDLRKLYARLWTPYISLYERHATYRQLCEDLTTRLERDEGSDNTDEDLDLPSLDELRALRADLDTAIADLTKISEAHERLPRSGRMGEEPLPRPKAID